MHPHLHASELSVDPHTTLTVTQHKPWGHNRLRLPPVDKLAVLRQELTHLLRVVDFRCGLQSVLEQFAHVASVDRRIPLEP